MESPIIGKVNQRIPPRIKEKLHLHVCPAKKKITHRVYSFEKVDTNIDDEGYPIDDSFFDSFGGTKEDDEETAYYSIPEWYPSDEITGDKETEEQVDKITEDWKNVGRARTRSCAREQERKIRRKVDASQKEEERPAQT